MPLEMRHLSRHTVIHIMPLNASLLSSQGFVPRSQRLQIASILRQMLSIMMVSSSSSSAVDEEEERQHQHQRLQSLIELMEIPTTRQNHITVQQRQEINKYLINCRLQENCVVPEEGDDNGMQQGTHHEYIQQHQQQQNNGHHERTEPKSADDSYCCHLLSSAEEYFDTMKSRIEGVIGEEAPSSDDWKRIFLQHGKKKQQYSVADADDIDDTVSNMMPSVRQFYQENEMLETELTVRDHGAKDAIEMRTIGRWIRLNIPGIELKDEEDGSHDDDEEEDEEEEEG